MNKPKLRRTVGVLTAAVVLMFGFSFALVPLYQVFCDVTGINGRTDGRARLDPIMAVDQTRQVVVQFLANVDQQPQVTFYPEFKQVILHPGQLHEVRFVVENNTGTAMVAQVVPSVSPGQYAQYLKKTECFCFTQQPLAAHERRLMPMVFYLDPKLPSDAKHLTLSYTLFDVDHAKRVGVTLPSEHRPA